MELDPATLDRRQAYAFMTASLIPRPICWISTLSRQGTGNLAPFSYFGGITSDPITVMVAVGRRKGAHKDTARNLLETAEGVIHIPTEAFARQMVETSADVGPEIDEFDLAGLDRRPSVKVRPPRIAAAPLAMEAVVTQHIEYGKSKTDIFFLEVVHLFVADAVLTNGLPDAAKLFAVGRLGGAQYTIVDDVVEIPRPGMA